jgi:hypothetical protein
LLIKIFYPHQRRFSREKKAPKRRRTRQINKKSSVAKGEKSKFNENMRGTPKKAGVEEVSGSETTSSQQQVNIGSLEFRKSQRQEACLLMLFWLFLSPSIGTLQGGCESRKRKGKWEEIEEAKAAARNQQEYFIYYYSPSPSTPAPSKRCGFGCLRRIRELRATRVFAPRQQIVIHAIVVRHQWMFLLHCWASSGLRCSFDVCNSIDAFCKRNQVIDSPSLKSSRGFSSLATSSTAFF